MIDLSTLYPRVRVMAERVLYEAEKAGLDIFIPDTGLVRVRAGQLRIYGHERWTLHYLGIATDFNPRLKCKLHEWKDKFDHWPYWNLIQCDIAVVAGYDPPEDWQRERDRPHCQCRFGIPEITLRQMWYAALQGGKTEAEARVEIWKYLDLHLPKVTP